MRHRELIAIAFRVAGLLLAIPSALGFVYFGYGAARFYFLKPLPPADQSGNPMIGLLGLGLSLIGKLFVFFGGAVEWALVVLSVVSFGCLALACILFFTGRGLHAAPRESWASCSQSCSGLSRSSWSLQFANPCRLSSPASPSRYLPM